MNDRDIFMNAPEDPSPEELARYIRDACGDDVPLRQRVEAMFAAARKAENFMVNPTVPMVENTNTNEGEDSVIGPYVLREKIGEGSFGVVFRADQTAPVKRQVALKIIKQWTDAQAVARFEVERQALAIMDHPNIAKVHDAGTTDSGRLYFVMELVDGERITHFCHDGKLGVEARLRLFIDVCHGVQHAHQKGIIHRDLKPSNILVTVHDGAPVPKVIDFGVAKATDNDLSDLELTRSGELVGTPAYMSPEQAALGSVDIDTRSDVYSLGVLLYELLTGKLPFDTAAGLDEIRRKIRDDEPPKPSTRVNTAIQSERTEIAEERRTDSKKLQRLLRGDLDWIVMKALEKERSRRYDSANALLADIERYLKDEPVTATPPRALYIASKFARRHRLGLAMGSVILALVVVGSLIFFLQWRNKAKMEIEVVLRSQREALLAQVSNVAGRRGMGLDAIRRAMKARPSNDFRTPAIGCLALLDIPAGSGSGWAGYPDGTQAIAFDPELRHYALCGENGEVSLFECGTGRRIRTLEAYAEDAVRLLFSPDGKHLALRTASGLRLWNLETDALGPTLETGGKPLAMDFSSDSRWLAYDSASGGVTVRSLYDSDLTLSVPFRQALQDKAPVRIHFQPDGRLLAIAIENSLDLVLLDWRAREVPTPDTVHFPSDIAEIAWHPSGHLLAVACRNAPVLLCEETVGGHFDQTHRLRGDTSEVRKLAFGADGSFLATLDSSGLLQLWDPFAGVTLVQTRIPETLEAMQFSKDNHRLAYAGSEKSLGTIRVSSPNVVHSLKHRLASPNRPTETVFDGSGRLLFLSGSEGVRVWDWKNRLFLGDLKLGGASLLAWNGSRRELIIGGALCVFRIPVSLQPEGGHDRVVTGALRLFDNEGPGDALALSDDGNILAIRKDGRVTTYSPGTYTRTGEWTGGGTTSLALDPTGNLVACGEGAGKGIRILRAADGATVTELPDAGGECVRFSPKGTYLVDGTASRYELLETRTWKSRFRIPRSNAGGYSPAAFDKEETFLAYCDGPSEVAVLRLRDREVVVQLPSTATSPVTGLAFSDHGDLAIAYLDQTAEVWDLPALHEELRGIAPELDWEPSAKKRSGDSPIRWQGRENVFDLKAVGEFTQREQRIASADTPAMERANALRDAGAFAEALSSYDAFVKASPDLLDARNSRANCLLQLNRAGEAVEEWRVCRGLDGAYRPAIWWLSLIHLLGPEEYRDIPQGTLLAEKLVDATDAHPVDRYYARFAMAAAAFRGGDTLEARAHLRKAGVLGEKNHWVMHTRFYLEALIARADGRLKDGFAALDEGTHRWRSNPFPPEDNPLLRSLRAEALAAFGEPDN